MVTKLAPDQPYRPEAFAEGAAPQRRLTMRLEDIREATALHERLGAIDSIRERMTRKWSARIICGAGKNGAEVELDTDFSLRVLEELELAARSKLRVLGVDA